jgi:hypothetical protein
LPRLTGWLVQSQSQSQSSISRKPAFLPGLC